jgi:hypothetical protein
MLLRGHAITGTVCVVVALFSPESSFAQSPPVQIPVWRTISLGTFNSVINLREALEASDCAAATETNSASKRSEVIPCHLGNSANEILGRREFDLNETPRQVQLVLISGKDLAFRPDSDLSLHEMYERAEALGYELCPPEVGPQLRLQYTDQKIGEFLRIAMRPIRDYAGNLAIFSIGNGGAGLLLVGTSGDPHVRVSATASFGLCAAFLLQPRQPSARATEDIAVRLASHPPDSPAFRSFRFRFRFRFCQPRARGSSSSKPMQ